MKQATTPHRIPHPLPPPTRPPMPRHVRRPPRINLVSDRPPSRGGHQPTRPLPHHATCACPPDRLRKDRARTRAAAVHMHDAPPRRPCPACLPVAKGKSQSQPRRRRDLLCFVVHHATMQLANGTDRHRHLGPRGVGPTRHGENVFLV